MFSPTVRCSSVSARLISKLPQASDKVTREDSMCTKAHSFVQLHLQNDDGSHRQKRFSKYRLVLYIGTVLSHISHASACCPPITIGGCLSWIFLPILAHIADMSRDNTRHNVASCWRVRCYEKDNRLLNLEIQSRLRFTTPTALSRSPD